MEQRVLKRITLVFGLISGLSLLATKSAVSAEFELVTSSQIRLAHIEEANCTIKVSGAIAEGDAARFREFLDENNVDLMQPTFLSYNFSEIGPWASAVCLDSPGGSFPEAVELSNLIIDSNLVTVVAEGGQCLSACAIVFLAGTLSSSDSSGGAKIPYRVLHIEGILGFHAPYLQLPQIASVPSGLVEQAYSAALESLALVSETMDGVDTYTPNGRLHRKLLLEMLRVGAEEFAFVDTIEEAGLYDINLAGLPTIPIDDDSWLYLCSNILTWSFGGHKPHWNDLASWNYQVFDDASLQELVPISLRLIDLDVPSRSNNFPNSVQDVHRQVNSRHQGCSIYEHAGPGSDFSVYYRYWQDSFNLSFRPAEPWQTLPFFVRFDDLVGRKHAEVEHLRSVQGFNLRAESSQYPKAFGFSEATYVTITDRPGETYEALFLGSNGLAKIYFEGGLKLSATWRAGVDDSFCVTPQDAQTPSYCARVQPDSTGGLKMIKMGPELSSEIVESVYYIRPFDIGGLP